ncbi:MAG: sulfatase-like hydrolase/transferase [Verrucomicrobiae bacterium]|nr:sulfatase-like hydrolase/transferase [Verrucomicrobiae bacterium]
MQKLLLLAIVVSPIFPGSTAVGAEIARPNVLMIPVDDLADYVSILQNHPGIKTPNFDRLAKRSVNFTRAYCAAPICQRPGRPSSPA